MINSRNCCEVQLRTFPLSGEARWTTGAGAGLGRGRSSGHQRCGTMRLRCRAVGGSSRQFVLSQIGCRARHDQSGCRLARRACANSASYQSLQPRADSHIDETKRHSIFTGVRSGEQRFFRLRRVSIRRKLLIYHPTAVGSAGSEDTRILSLVRQGSFRTRVLASQGACHSVCRLPCGRGMPAAAAAFEFAAHSVLFAAREAHNRCELMLLYCAGCPVLS